jgi:hypothetical protein
MAVTFSKNIEEQGQSELDSNLLESGEFLSASGKINVPLGVTKTSDLIVRDLSTIPHILVSGATGTGKTAFVKTIISIILTIQSPRDIKIVIYDTKCVDYNPFAKAPHMLYPIITEREKAIGVIKYLADESRNRFRLFSNSGCKDYEKYNSQQTDVTMKLPEIFVVMDDFAALRLNKNEECDFLYILRNGRIAGIHAIVISSMMPTKTIQKELMAAIPCRICFRLSTRVESRTILDQSGAEELLVPGEIIYKFQNDCYQCQSVYAANDNIDNAMKSINRAVVSVPSLGIEASRLFADLITDYSNETSFAITEYDDLISEAAEEIINSQKASIGLLQRKLKIGINRATRIMEQLEETGVVSLETGTKPRMILMDIDDWNRECDKNGLRKIKKTDASQHSNLTKYSSGTKPNKDDEPKVKLRDFAEFAVGESTLSVYDHQIHYTKSVMTKLGKATLRTSFPGSGVIGLIYKKPSFFSTGYLTFEFDSNINIQNGNPYLLQVDKGNISDVLKIEIGSGQDRVIKLFLQQLSEDIGVPIKNM